jgi:hypothetical protein
MNRILTPLIFLLLSTTLVLAACMPDTQWPGSSSTSSTSVPATATPRTPIPSLSATHTSTYPPPIATLTRTVTPEPQPTQLPVAYGIFGTDDGMIIGGVSATTGGWVSQEALQASHIFLPLHLYQQNILLASLQDSLYYPVEHTCPDGASVLRVPFLAWLTLGIKSFDVLAVSENSWQGILDEQVTWLDGVPPVYQDAIKEWLIAQGFEEPVVNIRNIVSTDLNQDGIGEVIIEARNLQSHESTHAGDYSVILMRAVVGNSVEITPIVANIYPTADSESLPQAHYLTAITDLNGDGNGEIVVDTLMDLSRQTFVFEIQDRQPQLVLTAPCRMDVEPERLALLDAGIYAADSTSTPTETPGEENPDKFAFTSCKEVPSGCEIYVMNVDGSNLVQLTDNSDHDHSPAWSPDGTKIAFTSNRDGDYEIYVMNPDGSEQMRLTASLHSTSSPNWSPDGTKITFISIYEGIYTMNADGSDVTKILSDNRVMFDLAWSPDGSKMAFIISTSPSRDEIFIMDADGTNLTRLLSAPMGVQNFDPAWSPDGTRIAFTLHDGDLIFKIYVVNADGSNAVFLSNGGSPTWSSDSSKIAYNSCIEVICGIYQMDANVSNPVLLVRSKALDFSDLAWLHKPQTQVIQLPDCTSGWTQLKAGSQAEVSSESDTPNRVRSDPGTAGEIIALLYPGAVVDLIEGPVCTDGLIFWKVKSNAIPGGEGWTAEGDGTVYWLEPKVP